MEPQVIETALHIPSISTSIVKKRCCRPSLKPRNRLRLHNLAYLFLRPFNRQTYYLTCSRRRVKALHSTSFVARESVSIPPSLIRDPRCAAYRPAKGWPSYLVRYHYARPSFTTPRGGSLLRPS